MPPRRPSEKNERVDNILSLPDPAAVDPAADGMLVMPVRLRTSIVLKLLTVIRGEEYVKQRQLGELEVVRRVLLDEPIGKAIAVRPIVLNLSLMIALVSVYEPIRIVERFPHNRG
jgi:hypothetical protein